MPALAERSSHPIPKGGTARAGGTGPATRTVRSTHARVRDGVLVGWLAKRVPADDARTLAAVRVLVLGTLLVCVLREDLASVAALPSETRSDMGVQRLFHHLPIGFEEMHRSASALHAFQVLTCLLLAFAAAGAWTRLTLPLGTLCTLVLTGILREYTHFFHLGIVPLWIAAALSFMPCADAWSVDRWLAERGSGAGSGRGRSAAVYGWCRFLCWEILALAYFLAGLSKLGNGGLLWWDPDNIRGFFFFDALTPQEFDFQFALRLRHAPDFLFAAFGLVALIGETCFPLVLFSRTARAVFPPLLAAMHLGVMLLQDFLFFDLIFLQLMFLDAGRLFRWLSRRQARAARVARSGAAGAARHLRNPTGRAAGSDTRPRSGRAAIIGSTAAVAILVAFLLMGMTQVEYFPLTAMQMYSNRDASGTLIWWSATAHLADGSVEPAEFDRWIRVVRDGRTSLIQNALSADPRPSHRFLDACLERANAGRDLARRILWFEIQEHLWNFRDEPASPTFGHLQRSVRYPAEPGT